MKKLFKYTWAVIALSTLVGCSNDMDNIKDGSARTLDPANGRELIALDGESGAITRASLTRAGLHGSNETEILMKMVATDKKTGEGYPRTSRNTVTWATASAEKSDDTHSVADLLGASYAHSDVSYKTAATDTRFWDDAFGRDTYLSIYAIAVPGKSGIVATNTKDGDKPKGGLFAADGNQVSSINTTWHEQSTNSNTVEWTLQADQSTQTKIDESDLTYSNNIKTGGTNGRYTYATGDADNANMSSATLSMGNGVMKWIQNSADANGTTGKFDQGHLVFKHALSKITIELTEGDGFNHSSNADFIWTGGTDQNIELYGFRLHGTFDVEAGTWTEGGDATTITKMYETTGTPADITKRTVSAFVLPDRDLSASTGNVIRFQIDHNYYYVTGTEILTAIRAYYDTGGEGAGSILASTWSTSGGQNTMRAGDHYKIKLTVGKKKIENITAEIVQWEEVNTAEITPNNTHTSFTLEDRGTALASGDANKFYIYRAKRTSDKVITDGTVTEALPSGATYENFTNYDWGTGYNAGDDADVNNTNSDDGNSARAKKSYSSSKWTTEWYWPNNKTAYHFRAVGDYGGTTLATNFVTTVDNGNDYFSISSGSTSTSNSYKDYIWGAPFYELDGSESAADNAKLTYSTSTGFDNEQNHGVASESHQISKAIAATASPIRLLMFHVTSQVFVKVQTTADNSADKVQLLKPAVGETPAVATQVNILRVKPNGTVLMGNGLVQVTDAAATTASMTELTAADKRDIEASDNVNDFTTFEYGVIPQTLSRGTAAADKIGLQIITPDGNEYFIQDLSTYTATSVSQNNLSNPYTNNVINYWYPNYQYFYTVTIKKTGIVNITAEVLDWETVNADLGNIDLEN